MQTIRRTIMHLAAFTPLCLLMCTPHSSPSANGKDTAAATASIAATSPLAATLHEPPAKYGPAVFHALTCPTPNREAPLPGPIGGGCTAHTECKPGEFCELVSVHGTDIGSCRKSACKGDVDCKGALCMCGPPSQCLPGNCRSAEDCGGRDCDFDRGRYGHGQGRWCRTAKDSCKSHDDCAKGNECTYLGDSWGCRIEVPAPPPG
jgi:hypothetical protein